MAKPEGVLKDVLIKVGKFIFLMDFIIMDMEEDTQVPFLWGRPFLATGAALIDVQKGVLTLRVGEEVVHFNLNKSLEQSNDENEECMTLDYCVPLSSELISDCTSLNSINENHMNFQYFNDVCFEMLNSKFPYQETVMSLKANDSENSSNKAEGAEESETSAEALVLKELPS